MTLLRTSKHHDHGGGLQSSFANDVEMGGVGDGGDVEGEVTKDKLDVQSSARPQKQLHSEQSGPGPWTAENQVVGLR